MSTRIARRYTEDEIRALSAVDFVALVSQLEKNDLAHLLLYVKVQAPASVASGLELLALLGGARPWKPEGTL